MRLWFELQRLVRFEHMLRERPRCGEAVCFWDKSDGGFEKATGAPLEAEEPAESFGDAFAGARPSIDATVVTIDAEENVVLDIGARPKASWRERRFRTTATM